MAGTAKDIINVALAEEGYLEKRSNSQLDDTTANAGSANYTKYGAWYGMNPAQWCAMFVSWCMNQGGASTLAPKYASCYNGITWFKNNAQFHVCENYIPQVGDVIFFSSTTYPNGGAHTGMVVSCDGTYVHTIEGNTSGGSTVISNGGGVVQKKYYISYAQIYGYGTPNYLIDNKINGDELEMTKDELLSVAGTGDSPSTWATEATTKMKELGIFNGDGQGNYGWQQPITREAMAVVLDNFMEKMNLK